MNPKVSIIVPVYNVEKYLTKCLDSLVNQTLESIEIIVVNDGSPDNSQLIINEFVKQYPNKVFSYTKSNGGLSDSRNFGLSKSKGEYIGFIDSDDWVELNMYEELYSNAIKEQSDLVICDLEYFWEESDVAQIMLGYKTILNKPIKKSVMLSPLFAWNKLYHRSLFDKQGLKYPLDLWYEDIPVTLPIFANSNKITYVNKTLVHYRQRSTSIMGSRNSTKLKDIFTVLEMVRDYFGENKILEEYIDEIEYLYIEHLILYGGFRFMRSNDGIKLMKLAFETINYQFPKWRRNPYISSLKTSYRIYLRLIQFWMTPYISLLLKRQERN